MKVLILKINDNLVRYSKYRILNYNKTASINCYVGIEFNHDKILSSNTLTISDKNNLLFMLILRNLLALGIILALLNNTRSSLM